MTPRGAPELRHGFLPVIEAGEPLDNMIRQYSVGQNNGLLTCEKPLGSLSRCLGVTGLRFLRFSWIVTILGWGLRI